MDETPDLTITWQEYLLSNLELPAADGVETAPPGLYRDTKGNTWIKDAEGGVRRLEGKEPK